MVLKRKFFGLSLEEFWFDEAGYRTSKASIVLLRTNSSCALKDCMVPEKTLYVDLDRNLDDIWSGFSQRAKHSITSCGKTAQITRAVTPQERELFYREYGLFAGRKGLLSPEAAEEQELDIFFARDGSGSLLHAVACVPFSSIGLYRYRYSVSMQKSQANAGCLWQAIRFAKESGFHVFDLGGIPADPAAPSALHGIHFFKSQFGGKPADTFLYLRANAIFIKAGLMLLGGQLRNEGFFSKVTALIARNAKPDAAG